MSFWKYSGLFLIICILQGCREYYVPDVETQAEVLVLDGIITDSPGPDSVKLSWAVAYDDPSVFPVVRGAKVTIIDNDNRYVVLEEKPMGMYYTPGDFKCEVGKSYLLQVETEDGHMYRSDTVPIHPVPVIDSMYANFNIYDQLKRNVYGEYILTHDPGIEIHFNIPSPEGENIYYRCVWWASIQYHVIITSPNGSSDSYWRDPTSSMIATNSSVVNVLNPYATIDHTLPDNFLTFFGRSQMVPLVTPPWNSRVTVSSQGVLVFAWLYSIDHSAYSYWKDLEGQIYAEGKLFDPLATQVNGNIHCISDPSRLVLGYFSAVSSSDYSFYVYLRDDHTIYSRKVNIDPDTLEMSYNYFDQWFWVWPEH